MINVIKSQILFCLQYKTIYSIAINSPKTIPNDTILIIEAATLISLLPNN